MLNCEKTVVLEKAVLHQHGRLKCSWLRQSPGMQWWPYTVLFLRQSIFPVADDVRYRLRPFIHLILDIMCVDRLAHQGGFQTASRITHGPMFWHFCGFFVGLFVGLVVAFGTSGKLPLPSPFLYPNPCRLQKAWPTISQHLSYALQI